MNIDEQNIFIGALTFVSVICLGAAVLTGSRAYRELLKSRLRGVKLEDPSQLKKGTASFSEMLGKLGTRFASRKEKKDRKSPLRERLSKAGFNGKSTVSIFVGVKIVLLVVGLVVLVIAAIVSELDLQFKSSMVIVGLGVLFFLPNVYIRLRAHSRSGEIRRHLPDAIDLLEICVSGGMGLDTSWNSVAEEIRPVCPLLADEMALTNLEMHLGLDRAQAMRNLARRTDSEDVSSLVAVLVQSERFGTSISEALRVFTVSMREIRSAKAEESAEKMSVKMLFPLIVLIFPVVLIVAVGPAGISLTKVLGNY